MKRSVILRRRCVRRRHRGDGCSVEGIYGFRCPAAPDVGDHPMHLTDPVRRRPRPGAAVRGQGRRRAGRPGRTNQARPGRLDGRGRRRRRRRRRSAGQRGRRGRADQPARREVRRAVRTAGRRRPGAARRRRRRSRSIAPGTPPRSSRYSARCRCCSTAAASASCSRSSRTEPPHSTVASRGSGSTARAGEHADRRPRDSSSTTSPARSTDSTR